MAVSLALSQGVLYTPPLGYPLSLSMASDYEAIGVVPKGVATVSADVYADNLADVHLALLYAPQTVGASDGEVVTDINPNTGLVTNTYQADALGVGVTKQTLSVSIPTTKPQAVYVVRLWADNFIANTTETVPPGLNVAAVYIG